MKSNVLSKELRPAYKCDVKIIPNIMTQIIMTKQQENVCVLSSKTFILQYLESPWRLCLVIMMENRKQVGKRNCSSRDSREVVCQSSRDNIRIGLKNSRPTLKIGFQNVTYTTYFLLFCLKIIDYEIKIRLCQ